MAGTTKLMTAGGGGVNLTPASSIASDVTVNLPTAVNGATLAVNGPAFSAYQSSAQNIPNGTWTQVYFQSEEFDTNGAFDNVTNYSFNPQVAGYYQISGGVAMASSATTIQLAVNKNATLFKYLALSNSATISQAYGSVLIYMNGTTDYLTLSINIGSTQNLVASNTSTYFQGVLVRAA